jgi:hypothetical protein
MVVATQEEATLITETHYGAEVKLVEYIGRVEVLERGPQAFTSTTPEGFVFPPHFHVSDQCQVFVDGSASMPSHDVHPVLLHYADAYTAYGPINVEEGGLTYFNLRARANIGAEFMPEARKKMAIRGGREIVADCRLSLDDPVEILRVETLIDLHDDGLAAYEIVAAPGARLLDNTAMGSGRFQLILDGAIEMDGKQFGKNSVGYVAAGERFARRSAGPDGAHLVEIQFPHE